MPRTAVGDSTLRHVSRFTTKAYRLGEIRVGHDELGEVVVDALRETNPLPVASEA